MMESKYLVTSMCSRTAKKNTNLNKTCAQLAPPPPESKQNENSVSYFQYVFKIMIVKLIINYSRTRPKRSRDSGVNKFIVFYHNSL